MFGLNSPDWYRWWKRLRVDSFDGSKLSQEGAANGIIWITNLDIKNPINAKQLYRRLKIKNIETRKWIAKKGVRTMQVSEDGQIELDNFGWQYLQSARCTSPNCTHFGEIHNCDPRVTGSIEHNMGRMIVNSYAFEAIMKRVDMLCESADNCVDLDGQKWLKNWKMIEVGG